jgi:hypothetical protein
MVKQLVREFAQLIQEPEDKVEQLLKTVETVCSDINGQTFVERDPHISTMWLAVYRTSMLLEHRTNWWYGPAPAFLKYKSDGQYLFDLQRNGQSYRQTFQGFRKNMEQHAAKRAEAARKKELAQSVIAALSGAPRQGPATPS